MALRLARRQQRLPSNPSLIRFLSNSSSDTPPQVVNASDEKPSQSPSSPSPSPPSLDFSYSSPFTDIKTTLKQKLQNQQEQGRNPFARSNAQAHNRVSLQDLGKNLAKFQRRSTVPPSQPPPQISLEALYKQNAAQNSADLRNRKGQSVNSNSVWENLNNLRTQNNLSNNMEKKGVNLRSFNSNLKNLPKENISSNVFEGVFPKSMDERKGREGETEEMVSEFLTSYNEEELGEKLKMFRPEGEKKEGWFSLQELNQRLVKLRQVEEKEAESRTKNFAALRNVISSFKNDPHKNEVISQQNITILGHLGGVPEYKHHPPKEELVDIYFHPDNLSSAEKMKIELTKVREEFKMSESDCGSARVQVAQLTTKIKHLSSTLHKKDKHSRKGLLGMVQKRKKLLKYLRRTDWDSYCLVLSKLSLRDNPDYKF